MKPSKNEELLVKARKLTESLREIYAAVDDTTRHDLHEQLVQGYCPTCAGTIEKDGNCWSCFESGCDI